MVLELLQLLTVLVLYNIVFYRLVNHVPVDDNAGDADAFVHHALDCGPGAVNVRVGRHEDAAHEQEGNGQLEKDKLS
jgi:hypothetical protein